MSVKKIHTISTAIAGSTIVLGTILVFYTQIDQMFKLDLVPQAWERFVRSLVWLVASLATGSTVLSILLGLYRSAEHR